MSTFRSVATVLCAAIVCIQSAAAITVTPSPSISPSTSAFTSGTPSVGAIPTPVLSPTPSATNGTNETNQQGGGAGGPSLNATCYLNCQGVCDPYGNGTCSCDDGFMLVGEWTCAVCPQGTYGYNCSMSCTCSYMAHGNRCNPVNGACLCTSCFTSANCSVTNGTTCLNKYLALDNAGKAAYLSVYGVPPLPPPGQQQGQLAISGLIGGALNIYTPVFTVVQRTNARPLLQTRVTIDSTSVGTSAVQAVLTNLQNQVKSGQLRTTLIIQSNPGTSYTTATLNT